MPSCCKHRGIISIKFKGPSRQSASLCFIFSTTTAPAKPPPLDQAICSQRECGCEVGIEIVRRLGELERFYIRFSRKARKTCQGAKIVIVCLSVLGRLGLSPRN